MTCTVRPNPSSSPSRSLLTAIAAAQATSTAMMRRQPRPRAEPDFGRVRTELGTSCLAPRRGRLRAVALLVLLAAPAPAGVVAADLVAVRRHALLRRDEPAAAESRTHRTRSRN